MRGGAAGRRRDLDLGPPQAGLPQLLVRRLQLQRRPGEGVFDRRRLLVRLREEVVAADIRRDMLGLPLLLEGVAAPRLLPAREAGGHVARRCCACFRGENAAF